MDMKKILLSFLEGVAVLSLAIFLLYPISTKAHPGRTSSDGCHYCRTNCDDWGVAWNVRHCHNGSTNPSPTTTTPTIQSPITNPAPEPIVTTKVGPVIMTKEEIKTEEITFDVERKDSTELEKGTERIQREGVNGTKEMIYKVTYTDGKETNREKAGEQVTKEPKNRIILVGTKEPVKEVAGTTTSKPNAATAIITLLIIIGMPALIIWLVIKAVRKKK